MYFSIILDKVHFTKIVIHANLCLVFNLANRVNTSVVKVTCFSPSQLSNSSV